MRPVSAQQVAWRRSEAAERSAVKDAKVRSRRIARDIPEDVECLKGAERAGDGTKDAPVCAAPPRLVCRRPRVCTTITATATSGETPVRECALNTKRRSGNQWLAREEACVVKEVARTDVVTTVNDDVVRRDERKRLAVEARRSRYGAHGDC